MTKRERIYNKFGGLCAYSGTPLEDDWQIEHIDPVIRNWEGTMLFKEADKEANMVPVQKLINHYKHSLSLYEFRLRLMTMPRRLKRLPKNPQTIKGQARKNYMLKIAGYFGITENKPFNGVFYFEIFNANNSDF